jgi:hypothetical protein
VSTNCKCAADALVFFSGSNLAIDTLQNLPSMFRMPNLPPEIESPQIMKQAIDWMLIGAAAMPHDCPIDTGEVMKTLNALKLNLGNTDDRELKDIIDKLTENMHLALQDCLGIEQSLLAKEDIPEQVAALTQLGTYRLVKRHDDGDMTIETSEGKFMVTTGGEVFKEVLFGG